MEAGATVAGAFDGDLGFAMFQLPLQGIQRPAARMAHFAIDGKPPAVKVAAERAGGDVPVVSNKVEVVGGNGVVQQADRRFGVERPVAQQGQQSFGFRQAGGFLRPNAGNERRGRLISKDNRRAERGCNGFEKTAPFRRKHRRFAPMFVFHDFALSRFIL